MNRILLTALLALTASTAYAGDAATDLQLVQQLAAKPFAAVVDGRCEIRGAVFAGVPRADVRVALISADGSRITVTTNKQGIYSVSVPYAGFPTAYREQILDEIKVRSSLAAQTQIFVPQIVCAK